MAESKFFQDDDDRAPTLAGWWDDLFPGEDMPDFLATDYRGSKDWCSTFHFVSRGTTQNE